VNTASALQVAEEAAVEFQHLRGRAFCIIMLPKRAELIEHAGDIDIVRATGGAGETGRLSWPKATRRIARWGSMVILSATGHPELHLAH
jgi:hypothetical protein